MTLAEQIGFDGRVAFVTGTARGPGRDIALLLARRGAAVVLHDPEGAEPLAREVVGAGGQAHAVRGDLTDPAAAAAAVGEAVHRFGRLDVVITHTDLTAGSGDRDIVASYREHVLAVVTVLQAAWVPFTEQGHGRVVAACSTDGGLIAGAGLEARAAVQGGLDGLVRALAVQGGPQGVVVNGLLADRAAPATVGLAAPAAAWLAHERCEVTGHGYLATGASLRRVFTSAALGYQSSTAGGITVEELRDHWEQAGGREPAVVPATAWEYSDFRQAARTAAGT